MYSNIDGRFHRQWASTILGYLAILVTIPIYIFYWKGPQFAPAASSLRRWRLIVSVDLVAVSVVSMAINCPGRNNFV
jgi:hypothetical protein